MPRNTILWLVFILTLAFVVSCSGGGGNVVAPPTDNRMPVVEQIGKTVCTGFWQVVVDTNAGTIEAVDLRNSDLIINVLGFLEPPMLGNMTIDFETLEINPENETISVDVILKHPIPDPVFMGSMSVAWYSARRSLMPMV